MTDTPIRRAVLRDIDGSVASLQEINEGDWVEYSEGNYGAVTGVVDGPLDWPTGDEETEEVGEEGENVYVVARATGGSKPFTSDELNVVDRETVIDEDEMPDQPEEGVEDAEMAVGYKMVSESQVAELHHEPVAELINIPGVDDPGVGWDSYPDSWEDADAPARMILLDAWTSMQGTFTGCMAEIGSRRICASMKDEVLGTERWRNRF